MICLVYVGTLAKISPVNYILEQFLSISISEDPNILRRTNSTYYPVTLDLSPSANRSRILSYFGASTVSALEGPDPIVYDNHHFSLTTLSFNENPRLTGFFNLLATALDREDIEYVSLLESKQYPITASQFHPEKHVLDTGSDENIPRTPNSALVAQVVLDQAFMVMMLIRVLLKKCLYFFCDIFSFLLFFLISLLSQ